MRWCAFRIGKARPRSRLRGEKVVDLPGGPLNHHWTKNLIASPDGALLYATVGSNSNVARERHRPPRRAAPRSGRSTRRPAAIACFASGLRNPNRHGLASRATGALWTVVNERDELGSDLVPDYLTSVEDGGFYGWPYSYFGDHVDERVQPPRPDLVAQAIVPDYALGAHTASLGLDLRRGQQPAAGLRERRLRRPARLLEPRSAQRLQGDLRAVRERPAGRRAGRRADRLPQRRRATALGRPVGVAIDRQGALLVADDVGNKVWRVTAAAAQTARQSARLTP